MGAVQYACTRCGKPTHSLNKRCARHGGSDVVGTHTGYSRERDRAAQQRFRDALLARAGGRCERVVRGRRCPETQDLRACHIVALAEGGSYDADNGELLCGAHDRQSDPRAR